MKNLRLLLGERKTYEEIKKIAKVAFVEKNEQLVVESEDFRMTSKPEFFEKVLKCLADLGYEFAILHGSFEGLAKLEERYGFKIPRAENLQNAPEIETLGSIVEKAKENANTCGAIGIFVGFVRKVGEGKIVKRLEYEAFNEILSEKIVELEKRVSSFPGIANVKFYHRLGKVLPGEDVVYIVVVGEHRKDIWNPLMTAVELMKTELPIWKKEIFEDGERWV
ncbi:MAG: molybdenum cofactor biosynthesis protein MoaE [Archaeoglobaceae archaeon]|nr:molybdenum cofactor biosynthesis protein MoaE [Archaeoglobaceae archaeon]